MASKPLTENEIRQFALDWFQGLNEHRPAEKMVALLSAEDLDMKFPGAPISNLAEFEKWYRDVTHTYFDQEHILGKFSPVIHGVEAEVKLTVTWKASTWTPPAATSRRIVMEAQQTWGVRRVSGGNLVIARYVVDRIDPVREG